MLKKRIPEESVNRLTENRLNHNDEVMDIVVPKNIGESPYLIKYYGALHSDAAYWVLSELMDTSLDFYYQKAHKANIEISELFLSKVAFGVLSAINYMKTKEFIHRDVKPSNILLNREGLIKLCDFGISGRLVNSVNRTFEKGCRLYMPVIFFII